MAETLNAKLLKKQKEEREEQEKIQLAEAAKILRKREKTRAKRNKARQEAREQRKREAEEAAKLDAYYEVMQSGKVEDPMLSDKERAARKSPATITKARDALVQAFEQLGGVEGLVHFGKRHPKEFYSLWGKLIPRQTELDFGEDTLEAMLDKLGGADAVPAVPEAAEDLVSAASTETLQ